MSNSAGRSHDKICQFLWSCYLLGLFRYSTVLDAQGKSYDIYSVRKNPKTPFLP